MTWPDAVTIGEVEHPVRPPDYATRLEIADVIFGAKIDELRPVFVWAGIVALHCPSFVVDMVWDGRPSNWRAYSRAAYSTMAHEGSSVHDDIVTAGGALFKACAEDRFPSAATIQARLDFSEAGAVRSS